jgi:predicted TIM-barrel fold metal-dependent hydrolase
MIEDAHLHFFSKGVLAFYGRQIDGLKDELDPATAVAVRLGLEAPAAEPEALAARWIAELDRHGVARAALFGSAPGEQSAVARAARAFPGRFLPFQMLNPRGAGADLPGVVHGLADHGIRGLLLFPALHGYFPDDDAFAPLYESARAHGLVVFVHLGQLKIAIRDRLGIATPIDDRYGDPARFVRVLHEHPEVSFIVPHFGSGTLSALLPAIHGVRNLYLDTSSSNSWIDEAPQYADLAAVFRAVLDSPDLGPERLLFGSDSTTFPRGWRADVRETQVAALEALGVGPRERDAIFGGNLRRLLPAHDGA